MWGHYLCALYTVSFLAKLVLILYFLGASTSASWTYSIWTLLPMGRMSGLKRSSAEKHSNGSKICEPISIYIQVKNHSSVLTVPRDLQPRVIGMSTRADMRSAPNTAVTSMTAAKNSTACSTLWTISEKCIDRTDTMKFETILKNTSDCIKSSLKEITKVSR